MNSSALENKASLSLCGLVRDQRADCAEETSDDGADDDADDDAQKPYSPLNYPRKTELGGLISPGRP
jgi:hypothetical protein